MQDLQTLETEITANIGAANDLDSVEAIRIAELGKKGRVSLLMRELGKMTPDEKKEFGPKLNQLKNYLNDAIINRKEDLEAAELNQKLAEERVDITLSKAAPELGSIHPISQVIDEATEIFTEMGFSVAEGPEIEEDFYNFSALNIPESHPARQMHDTFYFPEDEDGNRKVLRTHTSPVQIRTMMGASRLTALLPRVAPIEMTVMQRIRRCSIKLKPWLLIRTFIWDILNGASKNFAVNFLKLIMSKSGFVQVISLSQNLQPKLILAAPLKMVKF